MTFGVITDVVLHMLDRDSEHFAGGQFSVSIAYRIEHVTHCILLFMIFIRFQAWRGHFAENILKLALTQNIPVINMEAKHGPERFLRLIG